MFKMHYTQEQIDTMTKPSLVFLCKEINKKSKKEGGGKLYSCVGNTDTLRTRVSEYFGEAAAKYPNQDPVQKPHEDANSVLKINLNDLLLQDAKPNTMLEKPVKRPKPTALVMLPLVKVRPNI